MFYHALIGRYFISDHAIKQYSNRVRFKGDIIKAIRDDLKILNIRNIVRGEDSIHVFTRNYKEFIFNKKKDRRDGRDCLCLTTIIKRNGEDTQLTIYKRQGLVKQ